MSGIDSLANPDEIWVKRIVSGETMAKRNFLSIDNIVILIVKCSRIEYRMVIKIRAEKGSYLNDLSIRLIRYNFNCIFMKL